MRGCLRRNGHFSCICQIRVFPLWGDVSSETLTFDKAMLRTCHFCEDVSREIAILRNLTGQEREAILCSRGLSENVWLRTSKKLRTVAQTTNTNAIKPLCRSAALFCRVGLPCCCGLPRWSAVLLWSVVLVCRAPVGYRAGLPCSCGVP